MYENLALSDSGFLFDTRTGHTYSLSGTGTFLLRALMKGAQPHTLPQALIATYEVDPDTARRDVEQFLMRLRDLRLLESSNGSGGAS